MYEGDERNFLSLALGLNGAIEQDTCHWWAPLMKAGWALADEPVTLGTIL